MTTMSSGQCIVDTKTCTKCGETKPVSEFHKYKQGVRSICKPCRSEAGSSDRKARNDAYLSDPANREILYESHKRWVANSREHLRKYWLRYYAEHREEILAKQRERRARKRNNNDDGES